MNKINLLIIKNPITREVERKQAPYMRGYAPFDYIYPHFMLPENELEVFYGGKQLTELQMRHTVIRPGDYIVACPKIAGGGGGNDSKNILSMVAMIVITMYAGPAAGQAASAATGVAGATTAAATWNFWGYMACLGVQAAGAYVLNYFAKKSAPDQDKMSPTYGWDSVQPLQGQGQPVPVVLGTVEAAGQIIAQNVISDGTQSRINALIQCAEGPCDYVGNGEDGNCTGISNIKINENPLNNYTGIDVHKRAGLNNQSVIPYFDNTRLDQQIGVELKNDSQWHTFTTTGDEGSGFEVIFMFPGLYRVSDAKRKSNEVHIEIQWKSHSASNWNVYYEEKREDVRRHTANSFKRFRSVTDDSPLPFSRGQTVYLVYNGELIATTITGVTYYSSQSEHYYYYTVGTTVPSGIREVAYYVPYATVAGTYTSAFYRRYQFNAGAVGQYDVRCRCAYKAEYGSDEAHQIYWQTLSHILYDDFVYPNKTLLYVGGIANEQISGSLAIKFQLSRSYVWVWVPDNPDLDPWGAGSYQELPANNPAWGLYWLNHRVYRYWDVNADEWVFVVRGASKERMVYNDFKAWADFCDDKGITCNIYFDTIQKLREAMQTLEDLGRGRVLPKGTKIGCMFDGPAEKDANGDIVYSQVFNVANIGLDSFSEQWVDTSERATAIEVTYWDTDNEHKKEVMLVPADGLTEGTATGNITQFTIQASVPRAVAWKHCKYKLRLNNYINNTVQITTNVNAIVSDLGQVIGVQHDVPQWGYGGRVVSATTTTITLDKPVIMEADKTYTALFWLNNDAKIEKEIVTEPGETSVLTIAEPFVNDTLEAYHMDDNLFGIDGDHSASFEEGQLVHLFHETGDWTDYVISVIYDDDVDMTVVEVLNCPENLESVRFDWTMPHENDQWLFGPVEDGIKKHSRPFKIMGFTRENDLTYRITAVNYEDAVYTESETVPDIDYSSLDPIFEVENLAVKEETFLQVDGTLVSQINASWILPVGKAADRFLVYYSEDGGLTWFLQNETLDTKIIIPNVKTNVSYLVKVVVFKKLIYSAGVTSQPVLIEGKDTPPSDVTSLIVEQDETMLTATIALVDDPDVDEYELRMGPSLDNSYKIIPNFPGPSITFKAPKEGTLTFWCRAVDRSGKYSEIPASYTIQVFNIPPENAIYKADSDLSTWTPTNCWFGLDKKWYIKTVEKIGDFPVFADIFRRETPWTLESSPKLRVPVIDLGADVIEEGLYWIDDKGIVKLRTVKRIGDFPVFADIFRQTEPWELVQPKFVIKTFLGTDITWNQHTNNRVDVFYRTKTDGDQWTDWKPSTEAKFLGRQIDIEIRPLSLDEETNVIISGATFQVDVPEVKEPIKRVDIPAEGLDYTYTRRFYIIPDPWLNCHDINDVPRMAHITNKTKTGCHIALYDDDGNLIAGRIAYGEVIGY